MTELLIGDVFTLDYALRIDDALVDGTLVDLTVSAPDGAITHPNVAHPGLGRYTASGPANQAGTWRFRWHATGPDDATEGAFFVRASSLDVAVVVPSSVSLLQAKQHLVIDDDDFDDDLQLQFFLDVATEWVAKKVINSDLTPKPVQDGILEMTRHLWDTQRGSASPLDPDTVVRGLSYAVPNRVHQLLRPYLRGQTPVGSFPPAESFDIWQWSRW